MQTATSATQDKSASQHQVLEQVRRALLSLGPQLEEAAAVGVCGSLVRPGAWGAHSDIDIFVVVEHLKPGGETDRLWWHRVRDALDACNRDVNVLVYSRRGLEMISNWYVLRLAACRRNPFSRRKRVSDAALFSGNRRLSDRLLVLRLKNLA